MKSVAVITGATGGIGGEFVGQLACRDIDELWAVGRSAGKLDELRERYGEKLVPIEADLSLAEGLERVRQLLLRKKPNIRYLINCAGIGKMGSYKDFSPEDIGRTIDINCKVPVLMAEMCVPYMREGSRIINISSASAFQPVPYINLYASSKVFLRSWSRSLNAELKGTGITATAVCPGWVDTGLLPKEANGRRIHYPGMVKAGRVVKKALRDADRGRDMSVCSLFVKWQHAYVKLMPQKHVMRIWTGAIRKYI